MSTIVKPGPTPAAAPEGGQSGGGQSPGGPLTQAMFAKDFVARRGLATDLEQSPQEPPAEGGPENPVEPAALGTPGESNLPPEGAVSPEGETPEGGTPEGDAGAPENVLSQSEDAELQEALKGLDAPARKHLLEITQSIVKGETTLGELKRGRKTAETSAQRIQELETQVAELQAAPPQVNRAALPEPVLKLKTVAEVETRIGQTEQLIQRLEDALEDNPGGPDTMIADSDGAQYSRRDVIGRKRQLQAELKVLPQRAQQIQFQAAVRKDQVAVEAAVRKYGPEFYDAETALGKRFQTLLDDPIVAQLPNRSFVAACMAFGEQELMKRLPKGQSTVPSPQSAVRSQKPAGKVPLGKPHGGAGGITPRISPEAATRSALEQVGKDHSRGALANLLDKTGGRRKT